MTGPGKFVPPILCVDDEEIPLKLRCLVLQKAGYRVTPAASGKQALKTLASQQFDLVVSDLLMPEMTGTDLARRIKELYPNTRVILVSGVNEIPPDVTCADLFLSKVEGPEILCRKIAEVLSRTEASVSRG